MFYPQKENYAGIKTRTVQFKVYLTNNIVLIMEASITATAFHLQEFRYLPHAVEVFALLGYLHCKASQKERAPVVYLLHTEQY